MIDDDQRVSGALAGTLGRHGFVVRRATSAQQAVELVGDGIDVALLDLNLGDGDAFALCREIRAVNDLPIIMTTSRADVRSRVHSLEMGADDCLVKPYAVDELIARLHAVLRRVRRSERHGPARAERQPIVCRGVAIDVLRRTVRVGERYIRLTRKEFDLLAHLASWPGLVIRREQLVSHVWGAMLEGHHHTLDVHVAAVRAKCGVNGLIETVRGVGYRLAIDT